MKMEMQPLLSRPGPKRRWQARAKIAVVALLGALLATCGSGKSAFQGASKNDSREAKVETARVKLNQKDYSGAVSILEGLWEKEHGNDIAQLYSIALMNQAGFDLFDLVKKVMEKMDSSSSSPKMTDMLANLDGVLNSTSSADSDTLILKAVDVLDGASDQAAPSLKTLRCLVGGIYAAPTLVGAAKVVTDLQATLTAIQASVQSAGGGTNYCSLGSGVTEASKTLSDTIEKAGVYSAKFATVAAVLGKCSSSLSGATQDLDVFTSKLNKIVEKGDKGCTAATVPPIAGVTLPTCLTSPFAATATAGDKKVDGCELVTHCTGANSGCF